MPPVPPKSPRPRNERRIAFTLIELLVVMAIISVLLALLLPAVQQAREAARRSQCRNNLMQLGIALQNYEMAHLVLPPGCVNATGPIENKADGYHVSWIVQILPYIEQRNIYNHVDFSKSVYDEANKTAYSASIDVLQCPSSSSHATNYAGCHHDVEAPIDADNNGVLYFNSSIRYDEIADGSGNTIYLGELAQFGGSLGWMSGTLATLRNTGRPINDRGGTSPADLVADLEVDRLQFVGGFGSDHTGGAHFCLGDGSVRFLSDRLSLDLLQRLGHRADGRIVERF